MGLYLNIGNQNFAEFSRTQYFVDKSQLINKLLKKYITAKFVCNSRARRFGKSVTADMLVAYFSKGADSRHLDRDVQSTVRRARGLDEAVSAVLVGHGHLRGYRRPDQQKF